MDWLGFIFCVIIWVLCNVFSQSQAAPQNEGQKCVEGQDIPPPDECNTCICYEKEIHCTRLQCSLKNHTGEGSKCVTGEPIPKPDDCNHCICFGEEIHCSQKPCNNTSRIGPVCDDSQPVYRPDECNECYCFQGRLECSDLVCIRGSNCVEGQVIPKPDSCNVCKCHEGHILCTNHQCSSSTEENLSTEVAPLGHCVDGDYIPPPPPPDDCNTCLCINRRVLCTMEACPLQIPDVNAYKEQQNHINRYLQSFDKPISVEPLITMFSKNLGKTPTKLIHTHEYNGFHQEIKVHTKHLPKDRAKLLHVLANTLNNPTLAEIGASIKEEPPNSSYDGHVQPVQNSLQLTEGNIVPKNSLDSSEIHLTHSSKLITSGSQSNETILVMPQPISYNYKKRIIPLSTHYEKYWETVSSPPPKTYKNIHQIIPYSSEEEKLIEYYSENPPSYVSSFDEYKFIRNPSKFGRPGHYKDRQTGPTRNTVDILEENTESVVPLNPQPTNINDEKISFGPLQQDDKQYKPMPYEIQPLHPDQLARPINVYDFNDTSPHPMHIPDQEQRVIDINKEGSPSEHQYDPAPNRFNEPQDELKPNLPELKLKQNQTTISAPPQSGAGQKPPHNIIETNSTDEMYPPTTEFVLKDDGTLTLQISKQKTSHSTIKLVPPLTVYDAKNQFSPQGGVAFNQDKPHIISDMYDEVQHKPQHSQLDPNSVYSISQHYSPEIDVIPNDLQIKPPVSMPNSNLEYNLPETTFEPDPVKNTNIPLYQPSQMDIVNEQDKMLLVENKPRHKTEYHSPSQFKFQPDHESDLTMAKVYEYLNPPPQTDVDSKRWENKLMNEGQPKLLLNSKYNPPTNENFIEPLNKHPQIQSKSQNKNKEHRKPLTNPVVNQYKPRYATYYQHRQNNHKPDDFNDQGFRHKPSTDENPKITTSSPFNSQFKSHNRPNPSVFDHHGSADDPIPGPSETPDTSKNNSDKSRSPQLQPPHFRPKSNLYHDRGSDGQFINKPHHTIDFPSSEVDQNKPSQSQFGPPSQQSTLGMANKGASDNGFQYTPPPGKDLVNKKVNQFKPAHPQYNFPQKDREYPVQKNLNPWAIDDPGVPIEHVVKKVTIYETSYPTWNFYTSHNQPKIKEGINSGTIDIHRDQTSHKRPYGQNRISHIESPTPYTSHYIKDSFKVKQYKPMYPQYTFYINHKTSQHQTHTSTSPSQPQHIAPPRHLNPGMLDNRVSAHEVPYTPHSGKEPLNIKVNQILQSPPQHIAPPRHQNPGMFDEIPYTSHSGEDPLNIKVNHIKPSHPQHIAPPRHQNPEIFDEIPHKYHSGEEPLNTKVNKIKPSHPQRIAPPSHQNPGIFDEIPYTTHSSEEPLNTKVSQIKPSHPQQIVPPSHQNPGIHEDRESADGTPYTSYSGEEPLNTKVDPIKPSLPQQIVPPSHQNPGIIDDRESADGIPYTSYSGEESLNIKVDPIKPSLPQQIVPPSHQNPGIIDDRESADGISYISYSGEEPLNTKVNPIKPSHPQNIVQSTHQNLGIIDDHLSPGGTVNKSSLSKQPGHDHWNLYKPDYDQHNPSTVDSLHKGAQHTPRNVTSLENTTKRPRFKSEHDQYKPLSVDHLFNGVHEIPWTDTTNSDLSSLPPKPDKPQNKPSDIDYPSLPKENQTLVNDKDALKPEQDNISSPVDSRLQSAKPVNKDSSLENIPKVVNSDRFSPIVTDVKTLIDQTSTDDPVNPNDFDVGATNQNLHLLPFLIPTMLNNMTNEPMADQDKNREISERLKSYPKLPMNNGEKQNLLPSNQKQRRPIKSIGTNLENNPGKLTKSKKEIDDEIFKIFNPPPTTVITQQHTATEPTNNYQYLPATKKVSHKKRNPKRPVQFPEIHIVFHQPNVDHVNDDDSLESLEDGLDSQVTDLNSGDLGPSLHPKSIMNPNRIKHKPKDKKEECGDGTEWIHNCHECSCHDGLATCFEIPNCKLRPFGEPMICKPYSSFTMGNCYFCECNGDGVPECSASDCKEEEEVNHEQPMYHEFYDSQKTRELIQYYSFYKKLPKNCPKQTVYSTCEAGTHWVSKCHECECNDFGKHECIHIDNCKLEFETYGNPGRCKPNSKFYPKSTGMPCVECHCDDEGNPYCPEEDHSKS